MDSEKLGTPGPWIVRYVIDGYYEIGPDDNRFRPVARTFGEEPEDEANARQIAAAPEMFKILKAIAEQFNEGAQQVYKDALSPHSDEVTLGQWIHEIIARAEGI